LSSWTAFQARNAQGARDAQFQCRGLSFAHHHHCQLLSLTDSSAAIWLFEKVELLVNAVREGRADSVKRLLSQDHALVNAKCWVSVVHPLLLLLLLLHKMIILRLLVCCGRGGDGSVVCATTLTLAMLAVVKG